jgi:hypothetical protein
MLTRGLPNFDACNYLIVFAKNSGVDRMILDYVVQHAAALLGVRTPSPPRSVLKKLLQFFQPVLMRLAAAPRFDAGKLRMSVGK